jgi:hypothetical protein
MKRNTQGLVPDEVRDQFVQVGTTGASCCSVDDSPLQATFQRRKLRDTLAELFNLGERLRRPTSEQVAAGRFVRLAREHVILFHQVLNDDFYPPYAGGQHRFGQSQLVSRYDSRSLSGCGLRSFLGRFQSTARKCACSSYGGDRVSSISSCAPDSVGKLHHYRAGHDDRHNQGGDFHG